MTIGDVLAVVGVISGICLSLWVLLIGVALLFEAKAGAAQRVLENEASRAFGLGIVLLLPLGFAAIALMNAPGVLKVLGFALIAVLLATSLLGGAGLALLMGKRTGAQDEKMSSFTALSRGAGMMAIAWLFPVLGWFLVAPVSVITGLGAGAKVLWKRRAKKVKVSKDAETSTFETLREVKNIKHTVAPEIAHETIIKTSHEVAPETAYKTPVFTPEPLVFDEEPVVLSKEES